MRSVDAPPPLDDADEVLAGGHVWLQEWVVGAPLRVHLDEAGLLRFGDADRAFDPGDPPAGYRFAVRAVRDRFDRDALRAAVADPAAYTFLAVATRYEGVGYDVDGLPPALGVAVVGPDGRLDVARVTAVLDRLGLPSLPVLDRERHVRDVHPDRLDWPASAWRDGPTAGVLVTNRGGPWGLLRREPSSVPDGFDETDPGALAERLVTPERVAAAPGDDPEAVATAAVDAALRETWGSLEATTVDVSAVVDRATERARRLVGDPGSTSP